MRALAMRQTSVSGVPRAIINGAMESSSRRVSPPKRPSSPVTPPRSYDNSTTDPCPASCRFVQLFEARPASPSASTVIVIGRTATIIVIGMERTATLVVMGIERTATILGISTGRTATIIVIVIGRTACSSSSVFITHRAADGDTCRHGHREDGDNPHRATSFGITGRRKSYLSFSSVRSASRTTAQGDIVRAAVLGDDDCARTTYVRL